MTDKPQTLTGRERELIRALAFYADPARYRGPNWLMDDDCSDPWAEPGNPYIVDVTRDHGKIARKAIASVACDVHEAVLAQAEAWKEWGEQPIQIRHTVNTPDIETDNKR